MKPNFFHKAVKLIAGDCTYDSNGTTILLWKSPDLDQPSQSDIDAKIVELEAEYDAQEYARNRASAYPSTGDQLDYIFHNGVAKWKTDMIEPVKTKYPKPT